jgi:acyl-CoA synthetase (AMP-forming)/AMP-acid ligase II
MLHDALDLWAARQPEALFGAEAGRQISYAEAQSATRRIAGRLRQAGLAPGERIAVLAKNGLKYVLLFYAASRAGLTLVPLNTRLAPEEWAFILADAQPRVLLVGSPFVSSVEALADLPAQLITFETSGVPSPGWQAFETWLMSAEANDQPDVGPDEDRDVLQLYTSATTGRPKGAVLTQRAVCANIDQIGEAIATPPGERSLVVAPLFHAAVVPSTFAPLARGGSVVIHPDFRARDVLRSIAEEHIGYAVLVPAMLQLCLAEVHTEQRFEALRLVYYGSSPIAEPTLRQAIASFGCGFMQSYGMTEATQSVTFLTPADHLRGLDGRPELLQSAGRPAHATEIRVVDPDDRPLPVDVPGEIVVRGPQLMRGYWNQPAATTETLRNGWLHTGDIGTLDAGGFLTIRDRLKDMIVSGGENVYPRAIEDVLMRHATVADAAVIGIPDPRWGEAVKAVIVARPGTTPTADELIAHCRQYVGGFELPRSVDFVETLPRNAAGKVLKRVLRESYWGARERQVSGA